MGWLDSIFGGLSKPDYDKMLKERLEKEQIEKDAIFDMSKNVDQINKRTQNNAIAERKSKNDAHKEEAREERKKEEKAADDLKLVLDTAKLQCDLCVNPIGDLKVNFKTPTIQGKKIATIKEKDMKSLIFKGNCKKSPQSASPCASMMQLGEWKDVGTIKVQDQFPLLLKSTIKCNYGGVPIKITDCAQVNEPADIESTPKEAKKIKDFKISLELDTKIKSIVPFGIKDFKENEENQFFKFKLKISGDGVNDWQLDIKGKSGVIYTCYSSTQELDEVIVTGKSKRGPTSSTESSSEETSSPSLWPAGEYVINWDGFDAKGIYDSTLFNGEDLEAVITARKDGKQKNATVDFSTNYSEVQWTDVKIDRNAKIIYVNLRVNLTDGGAKGLSCYTHSEPEHTVSGEPNPFTGIKVKFCDWDKIPSSVIKPSQPIKKTRSKTFEQLRDLAIEGLAQYWGRNATRGKNVMLNGVVFEVFVNAVNLQDKSKTMDDIPLVYHTNGDSGRSGNTGGSYKDNNLDDNIMNLIPDTGVVQQLSYNAGYIKNDWKNDKLDGWRYYDDIDNGSSPYAAISKFKETAAHEIGHEILQAYYGTTFSWQHKGSSYYLPQNTKPIKGDKTIIDYFIPDFMSESSGEEYPKNGEIDLMKYYNNTPNPVDQTRLIADKNDVLGLIWLTKIKLK